MLDFQEKRRRSVAWRGLHLGPQNPLQFLVLPQRRWSLASGNIELDNFLVSLLAQASGAHRAQGNLERAIQISRLRQAFDQLPKRLKVELLQPLLFRENPISIESRKEL